MEISPALLSHLSTLSRLEFSGDELSRMQHDLERMTGFIDTLQSLDTKGVEPLAHMAGQTLVLHDDVAESGFAPCEATAQAATQDNGYFLVPKVIEKQQP